MGMEEAQRRFDELAEQLHEWQREANMLRTSVIEALASIAPGEGRKPSDDILLILEAMESRVERIKAEMSVIVESIR